MISLSIIIPVYNASQTLPRTLASLDRIATGDRGQVEVIAINDGSRDQSLELLRQAEGPGLKVLDQTNGGAAKARNAGLAIAQGEWIFFLDADDELNFNPVDFIRSAQTETCFGFTLEYRRGPKILSRVKPGQITRENWAEALTAKNLYQPSSLLFRRRCIEEPFREGIACVEDWLFWMCNPGIFETMRIVPEVTSATIHLHGGNISAQFALAGMNRARAAEIVDQRYPSLSWKQRNNLWIQRQIGLLQQRKMISLGTFVRFPCNAILYVKLWIYAASALLGFRATPYQASSPE